MGERSKVWLRKLASVAAIVFAVGYTLSPIDFIPDPVLIDDFLIDALAITYAIVSALANSRGGASGGVV